MLGALTSANNVFQALCNHKFLSCHTKGANRHNLSPGSHGHNNGGKNCSLIVEKQDEVSHQVLEKLVLLLRSKSHSI